MPDPLDPETLFRLAEHEVDYVLIGGLAANLHGSPVITNDADITPRKVAKNLERLAAALRDLDARIRSVSEPGGLPFVCDASFLDRMKNGEPRNAKPVISTSRSSPPLFPDMTSFAIVQVMRLFGIDIRVAASATSLRARLLPIAQRINGPSPTFTPSRTRSRRSSARPSTARFPDVHVRFRDEARVERRGRGVSRRAPPFSTRTRRRSWRRATTSGDVAEGNELVPQWMREWQATLFDHGWMIPGYPPELGGRNCTPVQTLIYLEKLASRRHPASRPLPRLRDRRAEPARVRQRRAEGAGAGRDPRRHDLVHRHERAERRLRPRGPADARRGARRPLRRQRPEGLDDRTR